jgi:hypothetical protein
MNDNELQNIIDLVGKKIETTMIGALARFESGFGNLWGHHKNMEQDLNDQELYFDNLWQDVRNNILNHGNKQIRSIKEDMYKILNKKAKTTYNYKFYFKDKGDAK